MRGLLESAGGIERHDDRAESQNRLIDDDPFGAIVGKDCDAIAGAHAQASRKPARSLPAASETSVHEWSVHTLVALLFQERARAILLRIAPRSFGKASPHDQA